MPLVPTQFLLDAAGVFNVRDLGPALSTSPLVGNATVLEDRIYRADGIHRTDAKGRDDIAALGIRRVIDLRSAEEGEAEGRYSHPLVQVHEVPIVERIGDLISQVGHDAADLMLEHYHVMTAQNGPQFAAALKVVAESLAQGQPVVFHCAAGKDRTALVAALLLSGMGVDDETVATDYGRSAEAMPAMRAWFADHRRAVATERLARIGVAPETMSKMMAAEPATMLALLGSLRRKHGSIGAYLADIGAEGSIEVIRRHLA